MRFTPSENTNKQFELGKTILRSFINLDHSLVKMGDKIDWDKFENSFGKHFNPKVGRPGLPTRLMVGLLYLKYLYDVSDDAVIEMFVRDPYIQDFCGYLYFQHDFPCDPSSLTRWRKRFKDELELLFGETVRLAMEENYLKASELKKAVVDSTVQEKDITFPTDSKLITKAREKLVEQAQADGIELRQSYVRVGKKEQNRCSSYFFARQFKRARKSLKKQKTYLGRVIRDVERKSEALSPELEKILNIAKKIHAQTKNSKNKIYSVHEPDVECISKGKSHKRYEFGNKVSVVTTNKSNWIVGVKSFFGNPYDGATLKSAIDQAEKITGVGIEEIYVDRGYRGKKYHPEGKEVHISGKKRLSRVKKRRLKRRSSIEPVIGHLKSDHRLNLNRLWGKDGDRANPVLAAAAFNLKKLMRAFFGLKLRLSFIMFLKKNRKNLELVDFAVFYKLQKVS